MIARTRQVLALCIVFALVSASVLAQGSAPLTAQVRGVLLDAEGLPAVGYQLGLKSDAGDLFLTPPTAADGSFALAALPPGGYTMVAFSPDGAEFPVIGGRAELQPGQIARVELRLGTTSHAPGRGEPSPIPDNRRSGSFFSRLWNSGSGGKVAVIAIVVGGAFAVKELLDDGGRREEPPVSPSSP